MCLTSSFQLRSTWSFFCSQPSHMAPTRSCTHISRSLSQPSTLLVLWWWLVVVVTVLLSCCPAVLGSPPVVAQSVLLPPMCSCSCTRRDSRDAFSALPRLCCHDDGDDPNCGGCSPHATPTTERQRETLAPPVGSGKRWLIGDGVWLTFVVVVLLCACQGVLGEGGLQGAVGGRGHGGTRLGSAPLTPHNNTTQHKTQAPCSG